MHKIRLINSVFFAHHGVTAEEQHMGGRYEVDVEVSLDFETAAQEDNLDQTLCYQTIYHIAEKVVKDQKVGLIERIAYLIANQVMDTSVKIEFVEVTVRKRNPPIQGIVAFAEVMYRKERN